MSSSIRHVSAIVEPTCVNTSSNSYIIKCIEGFLCGCGFTGDRHTALLSGGRAGGQGSPKVKDG